jgi:predicted TPR repeat methyltransferase
LAERWTNEHFSKVDGVVHHQRALSFLGPLTNGWALNVGCGCNTRFNDMIRAQGLKLEGIDISPRMIELARAADPRVEVSLADVCQWSPPRSYRFISAWDSLWHVPLGSQRAVMLKLMSALDPGGVFLFSAGGLDEPNEHWDSTMGPSVYYATLGTPGLLSAIDEAQCVCRHLELDQHPQKHLCVIVQRAA